MKSLPCRVHIILVLKAVGLWADGSGWNGGGHLRLTLSNHWKPAPALFPEVGQVKASGFQASEKSAVILPGHGILNRHDAKSAKKAKLGLYLPSSSSGLGVLGVLVATS
jgi:hypothetical protein